MVVRLSINDWLKIWLDGFESFAGGAIVWKAAAVHSTLSYSITSVANEEVRDSGSRA
jgi:hypothetical protein